MKRLLPTVVMAAVLALLTTSAPDEAARNRALALFGAVTSGGMSVGLLLGGLLTDIGSWRWTLFINVPIGLAVLATVRRHVAETARRPGRFDVVGAVTATLGAVSLVWALIGTPEHGWTSARTLGGFALGLALILIVTVTASPSLALVLGGITLGQLVALVLAVLLLPRVERSLAPPQPGGLGTVLAYGTWRGLQQLLRPGLLTAMRLLVGVAAGLAVVGLLEAARVYVAPALLAVSGLTSFLFVRYARDRDHPLGAVLRRADLTVGALVAGTVVMGVIGVALLPWLGPLLFGVHPDAGVVIGWLAFTVAVAATTPYGSLAAVHGGQRRVFAIRLGDSLLSLAGIAVVLLLGASPGWVPYVLAGGALLGGLAIRFLVLVPRARRDRGDGLPEGAGA
jgi:hypothetical protein